MGSFNAAAIRANILAQACKATFLDMRQLVQVGLNVACESPVQQNNNNGTYL